jgi:ubiquinone/menaquinone biosynthesis C-methylase UbiE
MSHESTPGPSSRYVFGVNESELERLGYQYRIGSAWTHTLWERAGVSPGKVVVDLGCGPGFATLELAQLVGPRGQVIAVDGGRLFCQHLLAQREARGLHQIRLIEGDVHDLPALGVEPGSVDVVFARYIFCHTREPARALKSAAAVLKPSGMLLISDLLDFDQIWMVPEREAVRRVITRFTAAWRERGGTPDIMRYLPALLPGCGLQLIDALPVQRGTQPGSQWWQWADSFFRHAIGELQEQSRLTSAELDEFGHAWSELCNNPDALIYTCPTVSLLARTVGKP